jgi:hypothetical protein
MSYTPTAASPPDDTFTITLGGTGIGGGPYASTVSPAAADAASTTAVVPATGTVGVATDITVNVVDGYGNKVSGEAGNLAGTVAGANPGALGAATENADTTYTMSYMPTTASPPDDTFAITLSGTPIGGGPYVSTVGTAPDLLAAVSAPHLRWQETVEVRSSLPHFLQPPSRPRPSPF